MLQVSIVRSEGVREGVVATIFSDNKELSPVNTFAEPTFAMPKGNLLRIVMKYKNDVVCSGSYRHDMIPVEGFQWLPLTRATPDFCGHIIGEVHPPRVLIFASYELSPVVELSESEELESPACKSRCQHSKYYKTIEELQVKNKQLEIFANEFRHLYKDCAKELEVTKKSLQEKIQEVEAANESIESLKIELEEWKINAKQREEFLDRLLREREAECKTDKVMTDRTNCEDVLCGSLAKTEDCRTSARSTTKPRLGKENGRKSVDNKRTFSETLGASSCSKISQKVLQDYLKKTNQVGRLIKDFNSTSRLDKKKPLIASKILSQRRVNQEPYEKPRERISSPKPMIHRRAQTASILKRDDTKPAGLLTEASEPEVV